MKRYFVQWYDPDERIWVSEADEDTGISAHRGLKSAKRHLRREIKAIGQERHLRIIKREETCILTRRPKHD